MIEVAYRLDSNFQVDAKSLHFLIWEEIHFLSNPLAEVTILLHFGILECSGLEWDLPK